MGVIFNEYVKSCISNDIWKRLTVNELTGSFDHLSISVSSDKYYSSTN